MRHGEAAFVDCGAWIALALSRDPLHPQAGATSFSIMKRSRIRLAFTFDYHFSVAGFRLVA